MATRPRPVSAPLTFDLPESLIAKLEVVRANHGLNSVSELVRHAVAEFDFASCDFVTDPYRQISVRVGSEQRALLQRLSRQARARLGAALRRPVPALPLQPAGAATKKAKR